MVNLKRISQACIGGSGAIFLVYLGDRISSSALVPISLYTVPAIKMFGLLLIMSMLISVSFFIENHLSTI